MSGFTHRFEVILNPVDTYCCKLWICVFKYPILQGKYI